MRIFASDKMDPSAIARRLRTDGVVILPEFVESEALEKCAEKLQALNWRPAWAERESSVGIYYSVPDPEPTALYSMLGDELNKTFGQLCTKPTFSKCRARRYDPGEHMPKDIVMHDDEHSPSLTGMIVIESGAMQWHFQRRRSSPADTLGPLHVYAPTSGTTFLTRGKHFDGERFPTMRRSFHVIAERLTVLNFS